VIKLSYDFEESIGFWTVMAAGAFRRAMNERLAPEGITYRQCQVLGFLVLEETLSQTELAERMHIEPPTLVGILDRMERDGWICRRPSPIDRRKNQIELTEAAAPIWQKITAHAKQVRAQASEGLTERQIETLKRLLSKVCENLSAPVKLPEVS